MSDSGFNIKECVDEIAKAGHITQLPPDVAKARRADIHKAIIKAFDSIRQGQQDKIDNLTRKLYIAEKAIEDSKL